MAIRLALVNRTALYFCVRRNCTRSRVRSIVELGDGGYSTLSRQHFLQSAHRDDQWDIGLPVACHVRAAVSERRRVDGELEGSTCVASANVAHQDVVVQRFRIVFRFSFLQIFTSSEAASSEPESLAPTLFNHPKDGADGTISLIRAVLVVMPCEPW